MKIKSYFPPYRLIRMLILFLLLYGISWGNYDYYLPYYGSENATWTKVSIVNKGKTVASTEITIFSENGNILEKTSFSLSKNTQISKQLGQNLNTKGWIKINSNQPLSGLCFFGTDHYMANIPIVSELSKTQSISHTKQTHEWDTDVRMCNPSGTQATVTLSVLNQQGERVGSTNSKIPANGSLVIPLNSVINHIENGHIDIQSTQPISAYALFNNLKLNRYCYSGTLATHQEFEQTSAVDEDIASIMENEKITGMSVLVIKNNEIQKVSSYGYANYSSQKVYTNETSQMLASVSKLFTGIALIQLYERGHFKLNDPINNYLPFNVSIPDHESTAITFRMLLTHTSSIQDSNVMDKFYNWRGDPKISLEDCIRGYFTPSGKYYRSNNFLDSEPGSTYLYSNMGAALEGYLVEVISGKPFNEFCNEMIFKHLEMDKTRWFLSEYESTDLIANPHEKMQPIKNYGFADYPNGQLHSNILDLSRFMKLIFNKGELNGRRIISKATLQQMLSPQIPNLDASQGLQFYKEQFNVSPGRIELWGHSGAESGISTEMFFDFENKIGIVVIANSEGNTSKIIKALYNSAY